MTQATVTTRAAVVDSDRCRYSDRHGIRRIVGGGFCGRIRRGGVFVGVGGAGAGIGLVSVSPWSSNNPSVTTFTVLAAAWFIAVQLFASGVGGYIAGRLRGGWACVHTDEVFFRDTGHGLLVWAVGAVMAAVLLAWAAGLAVSGAAHVAGAATEAVGSATGQAAGQVASTMGDRRPMHSPAPPIVAQQVRTRLAHPFDPVDP